MNFETFSTERLILRKITPVEFIYIFKNYSEAELKPFLGTITDTEFLIQKGKFENGCASYNKSFINFQLLDKVSGSVIGACNFHSWYFEHRRAEIGYHLNGEEFKRKGLMSEAMEHVIAYGFKAMNLNRIEACIGPNNIASLSLIKKFNFTKEGLLRQHFMRDNELKDSVIFSLLREEYESRL